MVIDEVIDEAIRGNPDAILKRFHPEGRLKAVDPTIIARAACSRR